jgi:hypothetical protein
LITRRTMVRGGLLGARAGWGAALLLAPWPLLRGLARFDRPPRQAAVVVLRVLGFRHLAQVLVEVFGPWPTVGYLGAGTDGLHALSDGALAVVAPRWRRGALIDFGIATSLALGTASSARTSGKHAAPR